MGYILFQCKTVRRIIRTFRNDLFLILLGRLTSHESCNNAFRILNFKFVQSTAEAHSIFLFQLSNLSLIAFLFSSPEPKGGGQFIHRNIWRKI